MPKIRPYEQQVSATTNIPDVRAVGGAVAAGGVYEAGRAIVHAGEKLYDIAQRQEIGDVHAKLAKARADWTLALQERANSTAPGDPNFAQKFTTDFSEYVQTLDGQFKTVAGQAAYRRGVADLSSHFTESAGRYQAAAMGAKAKQDYLTVLDKNRIALFNDPQSLPGVLKQTEAALMDPNGPYARMPVREREMLLRQTRSEMAASAAEGEIRANPHRALKMLEGGKWDDLLDADKKPALLQKAEIGIRAEEAKREVAAARADRAQRQAQMAAFEALVPAIIDGTATVEQIRDSAMPAQTKLQMVDRLRAHETGKEKIRTDPALYADLARRIFADENDPRKIRDENYLNQFLADGLTATDFDWLRKQVQGRRTPEGEVEAALKKQLFETARNALTRSNQFGINDPKGEEQLLRFMSQFLPEYDRQRKNGKSAVELLSPDSPDYLGRIIELHKRSPQRVMLDLRASLGTGALRTPDPTPTEGQSFFSGLKSYFLGGESKGTLDDPIKIETLPPEKDRVIGKIYNFRGRRIEWVGGEKGWEDR